MSSTSQADPNADHLAAAVAAQLGQGWDVDPDTLGTGRRLVTVHGPDGAQLGIGFDWRDQGRVVVTGQYPGEISHLYSLAQHTIRVASARGAKVIAAEIMRRLMPAYRPDLAQAQEWAHRAERHGQARRELFARVQSLLPGSQLSDRSRHDPDSDIRLSIPGDAWGSAYVVSDAQSVYLELGSVPAATMLRILEALAADTA